MPILRDRYISASRLEQEQAKALSPAPDFTRVQIDQSIAEFSNTYRVVVMAE